MTTTTDTRTESVVRAFYAAVGAPLVTGRKLKEFGTDFVADISLDDLESAGREMTGTIRGAKVVEQIQERVDVDQIQERVEMLREHLETTLYNWREQFTPTTETPGPVKVEVEAEASAPKKAATKKTAPKTTVKKKTAPKTTAKKKTAPKTTAKKKTPRAR